MPNARPRNRSTAQQREVVISISKEQCNCETQMEARCLTHLSNFDLVLELALKASVEDFALRRLEPVHNVGNASFVVVIREDDVLLVDELGVLDFASLRN